MYVDMGVTVGGPSSVVPLEYEAEAADYDVVVVYCYLNGEPLVTLFVRG